MRPQADSVDESGEEIAFSVLICTYNRPELLQHALEALVEETLEKPDEIVVVNGGDARTDRVVEAFAGHHAIEVKLVRTKNKNLAASRNAGLPHCRGAIVAMTDDDARVAPDWVTCAKRLHAEHPGAGAIGGAVVGIDSETRLISRVGDLVTFPSPAEPARVRSVPGVNVAYKREALERVGQQDESLFRGEDVDFNWRVKKLGYEILYSPDMKVRHAHRTRLSALLAQHFQYGRAYYLVRRKWPEMYSVYPCRLRRPRDFLKGVYFLAGILHLSWLQAGQLASWRDRALALPVLAAIQVVWKCGMLAQAVSGKRSAA